MGFIHFYLLGLLPLGMAGLYYAYRSVARGNRMIVSSTFILKKLASKVQARTRFKPPPRFYLDLLLVALLALAAAGIYLNTPLQKVTIVIDNSLSSAGSVGSENRTQTLLSQILERAESGINTLPGTTEINLVTSAPRYLKMNEFPLSRSEAVSKLSEIKPSYSDSAVEQSIIRAVGEQAGERIVAYTRRELSARPEQLSESIQVPSLRAEGVQTEYQNVGIIGISTPPPSPNSGTGEHLRSITVELLASTKSSVQITLLVERLDPALNQFYSLAQQRVSLASGEFKSVTIDGIAQLGVPIRVKIQDSEQLGQKNGLPQDDTAWLVSGASSNTYAFISDLSPSDVGLNKLPGINWRRIDPRTTSDLKAVLASEPVPALAVFHRSDLSVPSDIASLSILPADNFTIGNEAITLGKIERSITPSRWQSADPVLRYLNVALLSFPQATPLSGPAWLRALVSAPGGNLLLAGEREGIRHIITGFELLPYSGTAAPAMSILLMNSLGWLADDSQLAHTTTANTAIELPASTQEVEYLTDNLTGPQLKQKSDDHTRVAFTPDRPGIVRIKAADGSSKLVAVNFFSAKESNTLTPPPLTLPNLSVATKDSGAVQQDTPLARLLTQLAFIILALQYFALALFSLRARRAKPQ